MNVQKSFGEGLYLLATGFLVACSPIEAAEPPIEISGLKPCTARDMLKAAVQNHGDQALSVHVAIESYQNGKWIETWASLDTPPQEIPTKIPKTDVVQAHKSITYSVDIFALPIRTGLAGTRHRLRADGTANMKQGFVTSSEFAVCSTK